MVDRPRGFGARVTPLPVKAPQPGDPLSGSQLFGLSVQTQALWTNELLTRRSIVWPTLASCPTASTTAFDTDQVFETIGGGADDIQIPWLAHPRATRLRVRVSAWFDVTEAPLQLKIRTSGLVSAAATVTSSAVDVWAWRISNGEGDSVDWSTDDGAKLRCANTEIDIAPTYPADRMIKIEVLARWHAFEDPYNALATVTKRAYLQSLYIEDLILPPEPIP